MPENKRESLWSMCDKFYDILQRNLAYVSGKYAKSGENRNEYVKADLCLQIIRQPLVRIAEWIWH